MSNNESAARRNNPPIKVHVLQEERELIKENAEKAGLSVARYLREVGMGYQVKGVMDYHYVRELVRVNGDLGRLGGLLKLWLAKDRRVARFNDDVIVAALSRIEMTMDEMSRLMKSVVRPRTEL